jgi:hypothetical protein
VANVVSGTYRGRPYVARLTDRGLWVVRSEGPVFVFPALVGAPAAAIREEIERLFDALPQAAPAQIGLPDTELPQRSEDASGRQHGDSATLTDEAPSRAPSC